MKGVKILHWWSVLTVAAFMTYMFVHRSELVGLSIPEMKYYGLVAAVKILGSSFILLLIVNKAYNKFVGQKPK